MEHVQVVSAAWSVPCQFLQEPKQMSPGTHKVIILALLMDNFIQVYI
jgi:hypothetical protein